MFRASLSLIIFTLLSTTLSTGRAYTGSNVPENFTIGTSMGQQLFSCGDAKLETAYALWCGGVAATNSGVLELASQREHDPSYAQTGMALLRQPIPLHNNVTNRSISFETSFQFSNIPRSPFGPGDGISFIMLNVSQFPDRGAVNGSLYPGAPGSGFGLYDDRGRQVVSTLAVEFDTMQNYDDMSGNHVGVDMETRVSKIARDAAEVDVQLASSDGKVRAWIMYNSSSKFLEVRISPNNSKPLVPFLQFKVDLQDLFGPRMFVGFAASNGYNNIFSAYKINEWTFGTFVSPDPDAPKVRPRTRIPLYAGVAAGAAALILLSGLMVVYVVRRSKSFRERGSSKSPRADHVLDSEELLALGASMRYSYKQLSAATRQFREDSKLGQGGFGSVYRGVIPATGQVVAVKRVSTEAKQGLRQFLAEVSIISQLRHRNIVRLLGWCSERNKFLLVYEYMRHRSLDKALFHPGTNDSVLPWKLRFRIVVGAAEALHYLHQGWRQQVIHRDVKSSNIMLDEDFNAMLGDFGLARMISRQESAVNTVVAGTFGYIAPEVDGKFTTKTDVYAFGAVALEVACGRSAFNHRLQEDEMLLADWVWRNNEQSTLLQVVDPRLEGHIVAHEAERLLLVGLLCSHPDPCERPSMRQVLEILAGTVAMPPIPSSKPSMSCRIDVDRVGSKLSSTSTLSTIASSTGTSEMGKFSSLSQDLSSLSPLSRSSTQTADSTRSKASVARGSLDE
ncbi:hypothetical protein Mapa_007859 [Marchantia paleacea]|nr:hypothetical protein Mapa_007859 [Marchantia paleacea]